ncbi:unnamed protein product [Caenorhabditis bovis]|uniref:FAM194 C-terminal domain-containing protein n=1 Tax=Caenorhabditis bovis TaxID=2654633 RepID=A0A8S1EQN3_9PELO|nr:unnamed protein product [Caenorhabditis bovis]
MLIVPIIFSLIRFVENDCSTDYLYSYCPTCCAILYSSQKCDIDDVNSRFLVKENGNGVLGAIWDDAPKTIIVRKGCLLEVWDWKNQTGPKRALGLDGMEVFPLDRYSFENRISSLKCKCVQPLLTTTTISTSTTSQPTTEDTKLDVVERILLNASEHHAIPPIADNSTILIPLK